MVNGPLAIVFAHLSQRLHLTRRSDNQPRKQRPPSGPNLPSLPPEIWLIILEFVFEPLYADYKYCTWYNFPLYQFRHLFLSTTGDEELESLLADCRNARLVCKEWARITRSLRTVTFKGQTETEMRGTKRLVVKRGPKDLQRVIGLSSVILQLGNLVLDNCNASSIDHLLNNSQSLPNLRSLSIIRCIPPPKFWTRLGKSYPQLISLSLRHRVNQSGSLMLPQLEIIDIVWNSELTLNLPSLRHCSIAAVNPLTSIKPFLLAHGSKLESLLLTRSLPVDYSTETAPETSFWLMCPNLKTLGFSRPHIDYLYPPPPNHPLCHLRMHISPWGPEKKDRVETLQRIVNVLRVEYLSIELGALDGEGLEEMNEFCNVSGLQLKWIPILPLAPPKKQRWWIWSSASSS